MSLTKDSRSASSVGDEDASDGVQQGGGGGGGGGERGKKRLSVPMGAFFLITQMAGAGFLALPRGVADVGWLGIPMMILFCVSIGFSGTRLGGCWVILEERWPEEYQKGSRQPYMEMAERSLGLAGRKVAFWAVVLNLFGSTTVYIILISEMLYSIIWVTTDGACPITKCELILIVGTCLVPFTWLGSPKDFWQASLLAVISTATAVIVIIVQIFLSTDELPENPPYPNPTLYSFSLGFGAILFAFGGAAVIPTIQNDMADRSQFWKSVIGGFSGILSLYFPVAIVGYVMFGDTVQSNILLTVSLSPAVTVAIALEIINLVCTFMISFNPVVQSLEELLNVPSTFGWKRIVTRSVIVMCQMMIGIAVPNFGKILNLIGGSLITLCTIILPPLMYIKLVDDRSNPKWPVRKMEPWERTYLVNIMMVGILGGVCSTLTAAYDVVLASFNNSCFTEFYSCADPT